ncbi:MAG: Uncharacterized protein FD131_4628 [Rhodocyclaceae bacterium]|nr:MAG: Uncharacterized protein FD131_4628 [Rhodocyclaceae bacterium]
MPITTRLLSSEHGFDDFDVLGLDKVHRVCVGHGIKKGDIFNVYCDDSSKLGATWRGTLASSLLSFSIAHAGYRGLVETIPTSGEDGRHDWAIGNGCEDGFPVFVDDRQLSYRPTPRAAQAYALEIIARCRADGDYRINDKPSGFLPPPLPEGKNLQPEDVRPDRHEGNSVGDFVEAKGWAGEWIIESILLSEAGLVRDAPFQLCSAEQCESEGFPTRYGTMSDGDGHVRIWAMAADLSRK